MLPPAAWGLWPPYLLPSQRLLSLLWCLQTDSLAPLHSSPSTFLRVQLLIKFTENTFLPFRTFISFSSVQSLTCDRLFATPWTVARQASLSITNSQSLLKLMSVESVMPSDHLSFCLLPPQSFPASGSFQMNQFFTSGGQSIGVSASTSVLPMNIQD